MENYKLGADFGLDFHQTSRKAKTISESRKGQNVEFEFNQIICVVSSTTNLDWLWRDYLNSHLMKWDTIGPNCVEAYSKKIIDEIETKTIESDKKRAEQEKKWQEEDKAKREAFELKTKNISIELLDKKAWDDWKSKNTDGYGAGIFEYAENWAKLMQSEIAKGKTVIDCAEETSHQLGFLGITGFMYGAAVQTLSVCWKHGEELRKWHNKEYGHDGSGVVNPALLTVKSKT